MKDFIIIIIMIMIMIIIMMVIIIISSRYYQTSRQQLDTSILLLFDTYYFYFSFCILIIGLQTPDRVQRTSYDPIFSDQSIVLAFFKISRFYRFYFRAGISLLSECSVSAEVKLEKFAGVPVRSANTFCAQSTLVVGVFVVVFGKRLYPFFKNKEGAQICQACIPCSSVSNQIN